ncbi:MAG: TonB-dependent receptor [Cyclobacteriaceae bacterium]
MGWQSTRACILFFFVGIASLQGQSLLKGRVFDATNLEPLFGVMIIVDSTSVTTDEYGQFEVNYSQGKISFYHLGYNQKEISPSPGQYLNVSLQANPLELQEVIVQGSLTNIKLSEVPGAYGLITKRDLQRDEGVTIAPALNRIPGLYMHTGALNTNRITIRGIGSRSLFSTTKIRAYFDEIPLTTGEGETSIEDLDISLIQRAEIIKGPSSSLYGAGLGGSIRLISADPDYRSTTVTGTVVLGSYGLFRKLGKIEHSNDRVNLSLNYNQTHSDGYRDNNKYDRQSVTGLGTLYSPKGHSFSYIAGYTDLRAFIPSSLDSSTFVTNPSAAAFTWGRTRGFEDYQKGLFGISFQNRPKGTYQFSGSLFTTFRNALELRPFNVLNEKQHALGGRVKVGRTSILGSKQFQWNLGSEIFFDWYDWRTNETVEREEGELLSENEERRAYFNLFGQADLHLSKRLKATVGGNINNTSYRLEDLFTGDNIDQSGKYSFRTIFSPRLALLFEYSNNGKAFLNISHGFSPPTVAETLTPEGRINPEIQPETGYHYEVGIRHSLFNDRLTGEVNLYQMKVKNLLVARRESEDIFVGINAGKTDHKGLEMAFQAVLVKDKAKLLSAFGSYSLTNYRFKEFQDGDANFSGNQLTGVPRQWLSAGVDFEIPQGFYANLNFQWVDRVPINDANTVYSSSYGLLNVKAGFKSEFFKRLVLDLSAGINNLNNEQYASMLLVNASGFGGNAPRYYYPGLPRNYFSSISLRYLLTQ